MKTTHLKLSISKITFSTVLFFLVFLSSCSENNETITDDSALIEKIDNATKTKISESNLPVATETAFSDELADSYITSVEIAPNLGYKVAVATDNEERAEATADVYFTLQGKQLQDRREKAKRRRHKCFTFVLPLTLFMPDNTNITLKEKEDWVLVRQWYKDNRPSKGRPELVFPLDIELEDGTIETLLDVDELKEVKKACKDAKDKRKCFKLVLPVSFTMPDATVIDVLLREDFKLVREWHIANPDIKEKGSLNFPLDIEYKDGTIVTINDVTEFRVAKQDCKN